MQAFHLDALSKELASPSYDNLSENEAFALVNSKKVIWKLGCLRFMSMDRAKQIIRDIPVKNDEGRALRDDAYDSPEKSLEAFAGWLDANGQTKEAGKLGNIVILPTKQTHFSTGIPGFPNRVRKEEFKTAWNKAGR